MESETQEPRGGDTGGQPQSSAPQQPVAATVDTPVATPVPKRPIVTRRLFILGGFWTTLSLALVGLMGPSLDFAFTRNPSGGAREVFVSPERIPAPGDDPVVIAEGRFFLVNLEAGTTPNREKTDGGLLALWQKCPHLGCTVPWRSDFNFLGRTGWFRCPCHGSTYTKEGGILVAGPAPRPLDRFAIEVKEDNSLIVSTGTAVAETGSAENPAKTVPYDKA